MNNEQIREHTRDQVSELMWAKVKPGLWGIAATTLALIRFGAIAFPSVISIGVAAGIAMLAGAAFSGFKAWQAEEELQLKSQRIQANIDSNEFAKEFAYAMNRSRTEGIEPEQALTGEFAEKVKFYEAAMQPAGVAGGRNWSGGVVQRAVPIEPKTLMEHAAPDAIGATLTR